MRALLFSAILMLQTTAFAQEAATVFGLVCNESFDVVAKKVKLFELSEDDLSKYKILRHPTYWNQFGNDEGFTKFSFSLPEKNIDITVTSLRFAHNALADVFIQFSPQNDDSRLSLGNARAQEIARELGKKLFVLAIPEHTSEGFMNLERHTDWLIKTSAGTVTIGSRSVAYETDRQNFRSVVLARVKFSEHCGKGRRAKTTG